MAYTTPGKTREQVYRYVRKRLIDGNPPTVREVQDRFGFRAVQSARAHLEKLVDEGRLIKQAGKARGYTLPRTRNRRKRPTTEWVPVVKRAHRKPLTEAMESPEGYIPVQARRGGRMFAIKARGDSMKRAGILSNDLVIAQVQNTAKSGDIVIARVRNQATVMQVKGRKSIDVLGVVVEVRREVKKKK